MSAAERPHITCRELIDFLYLYLENELPDERRAEFDRHLGVCEPCREYVRKYRETVALGKAAFSDSEKPAEWRTSPELVDAILKARQRP